MRTLWHVGLVVVLVGACGGEERGGERSDEPPSRSTVADTIGAPGTGARGDTVMARDTAR